MDGHKKGNRPPAWLRYFLISSSSLKFEIRKFGWQPFVLLAGQFSKRQSPSFEENRRLNMLLPGLILGEKFAPNRTQFIVCAAENQPENNKRVDRF